MYILAQFVYIFTCWFILPVYDHPNYKGSILHSSDIKFSYRTYQKGIPFEVHKSRKSSRTYLIFKLRRRYRFFDVATSLKVATEWLPHRRDLRRVTGDLLPSPYNPSWFCTKNPSFWSCRLQCQNWKAITWRIIPGLVSG